MEKQSNPVTETFNLHTIRDSRNELDLRLGSWQAQERSPERYVAFLNGRTEWIEKYHYLPRELSLKDDIGFVTWDHRGQGGSGGTRAFVNDYSDYDRDAAAVIEQSIGDKPYAIIAHSMGGLIALHATLLGFLQPKCMILSSPLLGLPSEPVPRPLARPIANLFTLAKLGAVSTGAGSHTKTNFETNRLTHDYDLFVKMQQNPYKIPGATFGWVAATFRAFDIIYNEEYLKKLSVPILVMGGTEESVVEIEGFRRWTNTAAMYSSAPVKLRMIPGGKHELFSEVKRLRMQAVGTAREFLNRYM